MGHFFETCVLTSAKAKAQVQEDEEHFGQGRTLHDPWPITPVPSSVYAKTTELPSTLKIDRSETNPLYSPRVCFGYASGMLRVSGEMQCALWIKPREDMPFMAWRPGMQGLHMLIRLIDNKSQRPILVFILVSFISFCHSLERARRPTQSKSVTVMAHWNPG